MVLVKSTVIVELYTLVKVEVVMYVLTTVVPLVVKVAVSGHTVV